MSVSAKFSYQKYNDEDHQSRSIGGGSFGENKQSGSVGFGSLPNSQPNSGKSFSEIWNDFQDYKKDYELHFPVQDYLAGTEAGKVLDSVVGAVDDFYKDVDSFGKGLLQGSTSFLFDGSTTPQSGVSAKPIVYSDWSPAARLFGMDQDTAYSEHMVNTAHQREVADLKAAGLNPVLGISGNGSSSVSGNAAVGSSSAQKVEDFPYLDILGATAGLVTTLVSKKPALGYMVSNVFKAFD